MKIRDSLARINGDKTTLDIPSGSLEIIGDDDRSLFSITLTPLGGIRVSSGVYAKFNGVKLREFIGVFPIATNVVLIEREKEEVA